MNEKNFDAWSLKNAVNFYTRERTQAKDLYKSEASMILPVVPHSDSVLDVGCAAGNFSAIFKELKPSVHYVGVDTSTQMIATARRRYPGVEFHVSDGGRLPFADNSFDFVLCTSVLHHNPDYADMIADFFRVARRFVVVDLPRLVTAPYTYDLATNNMILKTRFPLESDGITDAAAKVPYVLANVDEALESVFRKIGSGMSGFACHGYYGSPDKSVTIPIRPVIFTVAAYVKGHGPLKYSLTLPPDALPLAEGVVTRRGGTPVASPEQVVRQ